MSRNRKFFLNNTALLITSRTEEGLPLVPTLHMNAIIWGILARAQGKYPVRVCHFVFMANHFHMLVVVHNPEHVSRFTGYVKGEIAHAVNRLLGRDQKTIWSRGYDSPVLLSADDVLRYIDYIYDNPTKASLVSSIDDYPGVSSWEMFKNDQLTATHKRINRDSIPQLEFTAMSVNEQRELLSKLLSKDTPGTYESFVLDPYAWMECFEQYRDEQTQRRVKEKILSRIENREAKQRKKSKKRVLGATALRRQNMAKEYVPKKRSRKMICICSCDIELRKTFVEHYFALCAKATEIYEKWKLGDLHLRMPPGILSPHEPVLAAALLRPT